MATPSTPPGRDRAAVSELRSRPSAQVLLIGGGINGLAVFRDLALQGVDVVLVERADFASGASAASSHMIHGGIRYLENGELRLVRESVRERNLLLKLAPHFVKPLETTIPIYSTFSGILAAPFRLLTHRQGKPKERGALLIKVGLTLYDLFSRDGGSVPRHRFHGRSKSLVALPKLNPGVKYTATYFDASVHDPERLALDVLLDGLATGDRARAANYVSAVGSDENGVILEDLESGERFTMTADVVVNASGPWTDLTNERLGAKTAYLGGTKGSHIVLDHPELLEATRGREIFFENNDGRIVLIYPLNGRVLIGTTDLEADARQPAVCTDAEVDYFIDLVKAVFPTIAIEREQIVYRYSGIRPLPTHDDLQPGFVSRDYRTVVGTLEPSGAVLLSLVGGKWTTFRALGEQLADQVLELLGSRRVVDTATLAIGGGKGYPIDQAAWQRRELAGQDARRQPALFERYGTRSAEVVAYLADGQDEPVIPGSLSSREVDYMIEVEYARHVGDILFRRTNIAFIGGVTIEVLEAIGAAMAARLGWQAGRLAEEIESVAVTLRDLHGVRLEVRQGPGR